MEMVPVPDGVPCCAGMLPKAPETVVPPPGLFELPQAVSKDITEMPIATYLAPVRVTRFI